MSSFDDPAEPTLGPATPARPAAAAGGPAPTSVDGRVIEEFARDFLKERRSERRWRALRRLAWLVIFALIAWALITQQRNAAVPSGPHTALIEIRGEIAAEALASAEGINAALRTAFEDAGAQAVVLRINSPGGSPVQAGLVTDEIRRLKGLHADKKLYAVCEELCASAAYYIAAVADEIFVDKASIVGSIGVLMDGFGFTGTMEKLGVERRLITAGDNKGLLDPFSPLSEAHKAYAQAMVNQIHQQFIKVVKDGRGARLKEAPETFSGLFWSGESAVQQGLADRLGSLDYVAREVVKAEEVIDYTPKENVAERLAKRFGAAVGAGAARALAGSSLR
ncbi:S49 family peptidase [Methylibium sp. Pch-M]|uniref:S49 family peptidase n=1 Tax=Methylibium sp. Pch-M TaxID=2082386 RepID=UPI0010130ABB|nr:S49 family peptidase [Methylibium sp. Pch-M]QAZ40160.1 S49 family peptidase [Methylibium sp. Pch-M]